jgi:hypothetical protein
MRSHYITEDRSDDHATNYWCHRVHKTPLALVWRSAASAGQLAAVAGHISIGPDTVCWVCVLGDMEHQHVNTFLPVGDQADAEKKHEIYIATRVRHRDRVNK